MGKALHLDESTRGRTARAGLLDLPYSTILHIAQLLPCRDLPSLVCTCRELASMAPNFYGERRTLDMNSFDKVSPQLCAQIIRRFAGSHLTKCCFKCDLSHNSSPSPSILQAIVERFLDNYPCDDEILRDLHSNFSPENAEWFHGEPSPRPIDVLAHCYMLDMMLSSQPALKELVLDVESAIFRVPKSKGYRQHWSLMQPFLTLQSIQHKCSMLERYICEQSLYQSSAVDMKHVQTRFLENCRHLKFVNIRLGLDQAALQGYEHIKEPLLLEKGVFSLHKWSAWQEDGKLNRQRMRTFAKNLPSLKSVAMVFNSRGTLKYVSEFLNSLPSIISLCLKCEFNAGYPFFDIDEGSHLGGFFEGLYCLASTVKKISLFGVPESEFDLVMGELGGLGRGGHRAGSWEHVRVTFSWLNDEFGQREQALIAEVFKNSRPQLQTLTIEAYYQHNGHGARLVFSKILSRRISVASSSSPSSK